MTPTGFDSHVITSGQDSDLRKSCQSGAAISGAEGLCTGAHGDAPVADLARLVEVWPNLPASVRVDILALASSHTATPGSADGTR
jgi:hypothetical protein